MRRLIDVDPLSGEQVWHNYDADTDTTTIEEVQDIEPFLDMSKALRKDDAYSDKGIKDEMWHYARIPNAIMNKMLLEDNVDIFNKDQEKEVLKLLNTKYSFLKTTRGTHA